MKDGYRYVDGKLEITDYSDNGIRELEYRHYQDNIEEILTTENTIEELYKMKEEKETSIDEKQYKIYKCKMEIYGCIWCIILSTIVFGGLFSVILNLLLAINNLITIIFSLIMFSFVLNKTNISPEKEKIEDLTRTINGEELVLETIKKEITKNKELLKVLKDDMVRDKENEIKNDSSYKQLNYVQKLEELKKEIELYYYIGAYENEMIENYKNDTLEENGFKEEEVKVLKRILEKRVNQEN